MILGHVQSSTVRKAEDVRKTSLFLAPVGLQPDPSTASFFSSWTREGIVEGKLTILLLWRDPDSVESR